MNEYTPPKKPVGAGALFFNEVGQILLVKPNYKPGWLVPGGAVEESESPREACLREVKEEIGLDINISQLLCVDTISEQIDSNNGINFTFYGGILNQEQISKIVLQKSELDEYRFVKVEDLHNYWPERKISRFNFCLKALKEKTVYNLKNGLEE